MEIPLKYLYLFRIFLYKIIYFYVLFDSVINTQIYFFHFIIKILKKFMGFKYQNLYYHKIHLIDYRHFLNAFSKKIFFFYIKYKNLFYIFSLLYIYFIREIRGFYNKNQNSSLLYNLCFKYIFIIYNVRNP